MLVWLIRPFVLGGWQHRAVINLGKLKFKELCNITVIVFRIP